MNDEDGKKTWLSSPNWLGLGVLVAVIGVLVTIIGVVETGVLSSHTGQGGTDGQPPGHSPSPPTVSPTLAAPVYLDMIAPTKASYQFTRGQVTIDGRTYQHGLQFNIGFGGAGETSVTYTVPGGARRFAVSIGNDDNQPNMYWNTWQLTYQVFLDSRAVATGHVFGNTHDQPLAVDVNGGSTLELRITSTSSGGVGATRADWADPRFE